MNSYFLDTSFLIDLVRGNENAIELYEGIGNNWATGAITIYELSKFGKKDYEKIFSAKPVFPFDLADSETSGDIYKELKRKGALISEMDMLIAGMAMNRNMTLVTRDYHFKKISGLKLLFYEI